MKRLLADIRALRSAYYADHTVAGDVLDVVVAAVCIVGLLAHIGNIVSLLESIHG